jgi:NAD+ synthase
MYRLPDEIKVRMHDALIKWIREWFLKNGKDAWAVIGISGGKDSGIAAALCVEALGKERVFGVLMPCGEQQDIEDSYATVGALGIQYAVVNIHAPVHDIYKDVLHRTAGLRKAGGVKEEQTDLALVNVQPRIRMTVLYAFAQMLPGGGRVVNTCNLSEDYVGYSTKYGDSAGDFSPFAKLTAGEVIAIGDMTSLPYSLVHKVPSDGLCGKTDEDAFGFTYAELDEYIRTGKGTSPETVSKIEKRHAANLHKLQPMPSFDPAAI